MDFDPASKRRRLSSAPSKRPRGRPRRVQVDENSGTPEKDLMNFIHLSSAPDFSFLDPTTLFVDYCKEINFDPYNIPADIEPLKRWNERRTIRPRATTSVIGMNLDPATEKHKEEIALQLLPLDDPRRKFVTKQFAMYNSASLKRSRRQYQLFTTPDVHWVNRFIGHECSSYGPGEVELFGIEAVVAYNECLMRLVPDAWHHCHRSDIFLLLDGSLALVFHHMVIATKVFRSPAERHQKVVVYEDCTACAYDDSGDTSSVTSTFTLKTLTNQFSNHEDDEEEEDEEISELEDDGPSTSTPPPIVHHNRLPSNNFPLNKEFHSIPSTAEPHPDKLNSTTTNSDQIIFQTISQIPTEKFSQTQRPLQLDTDEGPISSPVPIPSVDIHSQKTLSEEGESRSSVTNLELLNQQLLPAESMGLSVTTIVFFSRSNEQKFYKVRLMHSGRF